MLVVAWCEPTATWEAVVLQEGRMAGYGSASTRALAVERAVREAIRRGYWVPLRVRLAWAGAVLSDAMDYVLATIRKPAR